jgi:peroxiredoxin
MTKIYLCLALMVAWSTAISATEVGQPFPDFTLKDLNGRNVSLSQFRGKVVVLNFWMTTCPPCREEMPAFQKLQTKFGTQGVVVVGVSVDDNPRIAGSFARKLGVKYTLLIHPTLMFSESEQKRFAFVGLPTTYLIDREGIIRKKVIGFEYPEEFEQSVRDFLSNETRAR